MKCPVALYAILILYLWKVNIFVCRGAPGSGAFVMQDRPTKQKKRQFLHHRFYAYIL